MVYHSNYGVTMVYNGKLLVYRGLPRFYYSMPWWFYKGRIRIAMTLSDLEPTVHGHDIIVSKCC